MRETEAEQGATAKAYPRYGEAAQRGSADGIAHRSGADALISGLVLLLVVAAYVLPRIIAYRGVSMTHRLVFIDMSTHLTNLVLLQRSRGVSPDADPYLLRHPQVLMLDFAERWPTGVYEIAAPLAEAFGPLSIWTTQLTNLLFTLVLVLALFGLGREMGHRRVGYWGALLAVLCPGLAAHSWYFSLDYPLIAMVSMGLWLVWRTRGFGRLPDSVALGAWSALGLWIKYNYALYLLVPSVAALALGLWRGPRRGRVLLHAGAAVAVAVLLTLLLVNPDLRGLWQQLTLHALGATVEGFQEKLLSPWTLSWLSSVGWMSAVGFPLPLLLLGLPGLIQAHRGSHRGRLLPLLSFVWGTVLVLTLMANKMERYVQPLYPVLCLFTVWGCLRLLPGRWRTPGLVAAAVAHGAVLVVSYFHPLPWLPPSRSVEQVRYMFELHTPGKAVLDGLRRHTYNPDCELRPLVRQVEDLVARSSPGSALGVTALTNGMLDARELAYFTYLAAAQARRPGLLIPHVDQQRVLPSSVTQMSQLLLVHRPGLALERQYPSLKVQASRHATIRCGPGKMSVKVSLVGSSTSASVQGD